MRLISIVAFAMALAGAALAAPVASPGISPDEVAAVLRGKGHTVEITKDKDGDPLLNATSGAIKYSVYFFDRNRGKRYDAIQFAHSGPKAAAARIAAWNKDKRFGRAYLDGDGDSWLEMDVETTRGFTTEALEENLERWLSVLDAFKKYLAAR
jgi:hypothetical protein